MTDYNDPLAIIDEVNRMAAVLHDSNRAIPEWYSDMEDILDAHTIRLVESGEFTIPEAARHTQAMWMILGYIAGRDGWPLVGDPRPVKAEAES